MAKFKPYKLLESQLDSLPIQEGQFILTTDTNKLYSDTDANTRILISPDAITDLSVNGTTITYTRLDGTTGTITTKDTTYSVASVIKNGLMSASDKEKLDTIEKGAQANTITGVKGDSESLYRTGNVNITKTNIGLNNVENKSSATIRGELTNSNVTTALGYTPLNSSLKGANNGLAELDASGKVPASQLPSYVDDVLEYSAKANFPTTGETGKIYVDTSTNKTYRWGGSAYVEISPSIALGTTSSTAFRGDYGQVAYTHAVTNKGSKFDSGLYKIATNAEGHVTDVTEVAKSDITALGIPAQDTTYNAATTSAAGLMSPADKTKLNSIAAGAQKNTITGVKGSAETSYRTGNVNITAANIGLGNVENKSSETIREELTKTNITTALGYTPPTIDTDTTYTFATGDSNGTIKVTPSSGSAQNVSVKGLGLLAYKSSLVASDVDAIASSLKGVANGVAELDENGLVPSSQLPSYVDDVLEYDTKSDFPSEGESGKIYIDISTNQTYRWSGSAYAVISETLALGETSSTAYRGDRGKVSYDHSQTIGNPHQTTKADIGLENVDNTADADKVVKEAGKVSHFIKIQRNGSLLGQFNGSSEIITNIEVPTKTSELINDSDFITSGGSITGNAATATKLQTARTIYLTGYTEGSQSFDGTSNISMTTKNPFRYTIKNYNSSSQPIYYPIAKLPIDNAGNACSIIINGRLGGWTNLSQTKIDLIMTNRADATGKYIGSSGCLKGVYSNSKTYMDIVAYNQDDKSCIVYLKCLNYYAFDITVDYAFESLKIYDGSYTKTPLGSFIWSMNDAQSIIKIDQQGNINANSLSGNASSATKAIQDSAGQQINTTYLKNILVPGQTVTLTKGDGTTSTVSGYAVTLNNSTTNTWHKLGTFNNKTQGNGGEIWLFGGQGQNSDVNQNMWAHIMIKKGFQGATTSTKNYVAATYEIFTPPSQASKYKNVKFKVFCTEIGVVDVWVYFPYPYSRAYYYPAGLYDSFTIANTEQTEEPVTGDTYGIGQPIAGGIIAPSSTGMSIDEAIKSLSISGKVITITKGDNTTSTITTQDTTYSNATQNQAGLMSPEDKTKLDNISISSMPIGAGCDYFGIEAPEGFLFADGSAISRTEYSELFAIIGTLYGAGDGSTTFNLPDKRTRVSVPMKADDDTFNKLGKTGGEKTHKLIISEMPSHNHGVSIVSASNVWGPNYSNGISHKESTINTGGGKAHNNIQPYLVCNYIIKVN